jgi:glycosyltransferase involved in cell wall biosynthesis
MTAKHRLLFVSHEMTLSGAPIQLAHLVQWLRGRGWNTVVVAPEPGPLADELPGAEIIYEPQLLIDPHYGALRRLAPLFDAVVANTIATWEAVQACDKERVPVIWYLHETEVGHQLMQLIHMIEPSLALADTVVTPTRRTAGIYAPFRPQPIEVIPYGIPAVEPLPHMSRPPLRFLTLGTIEQRKGQDVLLDAVERLPAQLNEQVRFQLAGRELEERFAEEIRARAASLPNVQLIGALTHREALLHLTQADALILPSRDETMPIALLEAMSVSKPIITTAVGGIDEWIHDHANGLLVEPENAAALATAIERLATDVELRGRLGMNGRQTFADHFTIEAFGTRFENIIIETTARASAQRV